MFIVYIYICIYILCKYIHIYNICRTRLLIKINNAMHQRCFYQYIWTVLPHCWPGGCYSIRSVCYCYMLMLLQAKRSESAEGVLEERLRRSLCMFIWESLTTNKIFKYCRRDFGWKPIFVFFVLNPFLKLTRPDPTMTLFDGLYFGQYFRYRREIFTKSWFKFQDCPIKIFDSYLS